MSSRSPAAFGDTRHVQVGISWDNGGEFGYAQLSYRHVERCGCGTYRIQGEADAFPPVDEVSVSISGTREGDTDRLAAEVTSADPLTLLVEAESPALYRWWATGCLECGGDGQ